MTKSGFLNDKVSYSKEQKIDDPHNKILLIYDNKIIKKIIGPINENLIVEIKMLIQ